MRIKPKILASDPPSIIMPATVLYQSGKSKMDFDNKPKYCNLLINRQLRRLCLASFFDLIAAHMVGRAEWKNRVIRKYIIENPAKWELDPEYRCDI